MQLERSFQERWRGKSFPAVLRSLGVPVEVPGGDGGNDSSGGGGGSGAAKTTSAIMVHKAYKKALRLYHPDRAVQQQQPWQQVVEAEEVYKLLQTLYEQYTAKQAARAQQQQRQQQSQPQQRPGSRGGMQRPGSRGRMQRPGSRGGL